MPNWVYNSLSLEGPKDEVSKVKAQLNTSFTKVHENWNGETKAMEFKEYKYTNPIFAFHNIYNHIQDGVPEEVYQAQGDDSKDMKEALMFAGNNWYDWNVRNWGTKWDVAVHDDEKYPDTHMTDEGDEYISYSFNTAWSPPTEAIEKLVAQYPNLTINLTYQEEQGWGGEITWEGGEVSEQSEYGWQCRNCDHTEDDTPYCEDCDYDTCPQCGWGEPDEMCEKHSEMSNA